MSPAILVAGATGNTGRSVVETLPKLLSGSNALKGHRIIALTRSLKSEAAQKLAEIPGVEIVEQNWVEITAEWLRKHQVVRAFIAAHNQPNQFAEESTFHLNALKAGVQFVVRISTTAPNVRPDCGAYYPRSHWAIEAMLSAPEFEALQWASLQPNGFIPFVMTPAAELIKHYRRTGEQQPLRLIAGEHAPCAYIDPHDVGVVAAHLLSQEDVAVHSKAKYVLNGPEDITGEDIVKMVEQHIGAKVQDVRYEDVSFIEQMLAASQESRNVITSSKLGLETVWRGECTASTTSRAIVELAAPRRTCAQVLETLLRE